MVDLQLEIPDSFLQEEVRSGHLVSKKMKEIWAIELDLLMELQHVCKKYDLKLCAESGTLLGAVRHQGFIPWDDDIDVAMPRKDYTHLCKIAKEEFTSPYFLDYYGSDITFDNGFAKLMNLNTTFQQNTTSGISLYHLSISSDMGFCSFGRKADLGNVCHCDNSYVGNACIGKESL